MVNRRGVGAWAGEDCYDPDRPWWLPPFLDTLGEEQCRLTGAISGAMQTTPPTPWGGSAPRAPQTIEEMSVGGAWTPGMSVPDYQDWAGRFGDSIPDPAIDWKNVAMMAAAVVALVWVIGKVKG